MDEYSDYSVSEVPEPLKDEDKWFGMTKRQLAILLPCALVCIGLTTFFSGFHMYLVGIALSVVIMGGAVFITFYSIGPDKYLYGCGLKIEVVLFRIIKKKLPWNKKVYTRINEEEE